MTLKPTDDLADKLDQLGPPRAEVRLDLRPFAILLGGLWRLLLGLGMLVAGCFILHVQFAQGGSGKVLLIGFGLALGGLGILLQAVVGTVRLYRRGNSRLLIFPEGLVLSQRCGERAIRWDQVRALVQGATRHDLYGKMTTGADQVRALAQGATPHDLYGEMRSGAIRVAAPHRGATGQLYVLIRRDGFRLRIGSEIPGFSELWAMIKQETLKALLPGCLATFDAGDSLYFGSLRVNRDGIHKAQDCLPWSAVKEIKIDERGQLIIRSGIRTWLEDAGVDYPNVHVLQALADHGRAYQRGQVVDVPMLQALAEQGRANPHGEPAGSELPQRGPASKVVDEVFEAGYIPPSAAPDPLSN